jgi:hypothetical protein
MVSRRERGTRGGAQPLTPKRSKDRARGWLLNTGFVTVANRGTETVDWLFAGDSKMCLTAITAIDAAGEELPSWILSRGKMRRCKRCYRTDDARHRASTHGESVV